MNSEQISILTPEQKGIRIFQFLGWTCCGEGIPGELLPHGLPPYRKLADYTTQQILDGDVPIEALPPIDLNEIHQAELKLTDEQYHRFRLHLWNLVNRRNLNEGFIQRERIFLSATAAQRADALLMVILNDQPND